MSAPAPTLDHIPEWGDPWGHPDYFRGITVRRVYAYCLDLVVVAILLGLVYAGGLILVALTLGLVWPLLVVMVGIVPIAYHTLSIAGANSATLGMRAAGIRVMSILPQSDGRPSLVQALFQTLGFYLSVAFTCWLILLAVFFNPRRRAVHDALAGTVVVNNLGQ